MTGMELGDKLCVFNLINEECCVQFSKMPHNAVAPWILLSTIRTHCARKGGPPLKADDDALRGFLNELSLTEGYHNECYLGESYVHGFHLSQCKLRRSSQRGISDIITASSGGN